jgi:hypothetical protein
VLAVTRGGRNEHDIVGGNKSAVSLLSGAGRQRATLSRGRASHSAVQGGMGPSAHVYANGGKHINSRSAGTSDRHTINGENLLSMRSF